MANFLRKLFGASATIEQLARGDDREAFMRRLGGTDIFVIAAIDGDGLDPSTMTKEQLLAEMEQAAKDLDARQEGFAPFVYEEKGTRRLPFFTTGEGPQRFAAVYSKQRGRVYPFQTLQIRGSLLGRLVPTCDVLVMNDRSDQEVELSADDIATIRRMWE